MLEKVLSIYSPPGIIIDSVDNIVQIIGNINQFISLNAGKFSSNIYSLLPEDLGLYVSNFIRRLKKTKESIRSDFFVETRGANSQKVSLEGHVIESEKSVFFLINFITQNENNTGSLKNVEKDLISEDYSERISGLEKELQLSREALQATIEELETSNEELQSSNEELIASNEELQSTNEELQSVNEELYTVNSEFQIKIDELERLNNDMNNLINNTEIGALYLDRNLCIRKITPVISRITNIIPSDLGRPLSHIATFNNNQLIMKDILKVTESLQTVENEYQDDKGNYYLVSTRPYRVDNNAVDGILVTFVGINSFKNEQRKSYVANKRLSDSLDLGNMAWWEWDVKTGKVVFDEKKATMIGYTVDEFPDNVDKICEFIHPDDYDYTMDAMRAHLYGQVDSYTVTYRIKRKDGTYAWYFDKGAISERSDSGAPLKVIGTVIDVSILKSMEMELNQKNSLLKKAFDSDVIPKFIINIEGKVVYSNLAANSYFNVQSEEHLSGIFSTFVFLDEDENVIEKSNLFLDFNNLPYDTKFVKLYSASTKTSYKMKISMRKILEQNRLLGVAINILE